MKRPPGLWLLLSAGVLWLCFQDISCVRGTSLIFGKTTTTSTSTSTTVAPNADAAAEEEGVTEPTEVVNGTKLSGIPQQDYLLDPNLPRELDGYNLTEYPFYERVPEDLNFSCDGLHDGFYASIAHKCQVYHHCLFGTRFDFLCANYTAFDQKTFICHFVSEVDCVNSKKFWHRNDALYEAQSTTTIKPQIVYTPPAPPAILGGSRRQAAGQASLAPLAPGAPRRPKPPRRRRPSYEYYDDEDYDEDEYYDDPRYTATEAPRSEARRRKRPRPRPRPVYDDEYDEYEDERYDRRRGGGSRRDDDRPYRRRPAGRRNKHERRKYEDEYEEEVDEEDPRFDGSEERKNKRRPGGKRKKEDEAEEEEPRYRPRKGQRRPADDDYEDEDARKPSRKKEDGEDARKPGRRKEDDEDARKPSRRKEDDEDARKPSRRKEDDDDSRRPNRKKEEDDERRPNRKKEDDEERRPNRKKDDDDRRPSRKSTTEEPKAMVKSSGGSVYDRPRVAPRIRPPVPKSEADKFAFKPSSTTAKPSKKQADEEYSYEEYEEEPVRKTRPKGRALFPKRAK